VFDGRFKRKRWYADASVRISLLGPGEIFLKTLCELSFLLFSARKQNSGSDLTANARVSALVPSPLIEEVFKFWFKTKPKFIWITFPYMSMSDKAFNLQFNFF